jgi:pyruvate formate lyase activating enzyme
MHEARFYERSGEAAVRCDLCPHACLIQDGRNGLCGVRKNRGGTLYSCVYGRAIAEHADPVEKKPLFHVLPGSRSYSMATAGCNLSCQHCQNADIAHLPRVRGVPETPQRSPEDIVAAALSAGCSSIACTYTEPTVYFEYALDIAACAQSAGLKTIFVTNGYIAPAAIEEIAPVLDAANIDLKAFSDDFYRTVCGARLQPVLDAISCYRKCGVWIEITTLIIPGLNDSPDELQRTAEFIASVGTDIPWHVSAFYPTYRMTDRPPTPPETLLIAREIGLTSGLRYVYTGNIPGQGGEDTLCHRCGAMLIKRRGYRIHADALNQGSCTQCGTSCAGIFD